MTRINCVPPSELTDQHLLAEYRELPRVFRLARPDADIPSSYCMGKGHVTFFYDKLYWCYIRQHAVYREMKRRGFKPRYHPNNLLPHKIDNPVLWNDWKPTSEALAINRARIAESLTRSREKAS